MHVCIDSSTPRWRCLHRNVFDIGVTAPTGIPLPCMRPAISAERTGKSNASNEGTSTASRTPRPTGAATDGKVVHAEADPGEYNSHCRPKQDVKGVVSIVGPSGGSNEKSRRRWHKGDDHYQHWRRSAACPGRGAIISRGFSFDWELW